MKLSTTDKRRIKAMIDAGEYLPPEYRDALFKPASAPELTWAGKSAPPAMGKVRLQILERVDPDGQGLFNSFDARNSEAQLTLKVNYGEDGPWRNRLIQGDNYPVLRELLHGPLRREIDAAGGLKLVYIDPPFDAGVDFLFRQQVGAERDRARVLAQHGFTDRWGQGADSYLSMMYPRLRLIHELLSAEGSLYVHCDWRVNGALRLLLEEIFGKKKFLNEIVWHYYNKYSAASRHLPRAHDSILVFSKTGRHTFNPFRINREMPVRQLVRKNVGGTLKNARGADGRLMYREVTDKKADDVWRMPQLQPASSQWSGYETQKHHDLLARIIRMGSNPGDLVGDFFCGSGTTLSVAQELGRKWIGCDKSSKSVRLVRKRMLLRGHAENWTVQPQPFDMLQAVTLDGAGPPGKSGANADGVFGDNVIDDNVIENGLEVAVDQAGLAVGVTLCGIDPAATSETAIAPAATRSGGDPLRVAGNRLYRLVNSKGGEAAEILLTEHWHDWLDAWSVDFDHGRPHAATAPESERSAAAVSSPPPTVFQGHWHAARTRKLRGLPLSSGQIVYPSSGRYRIAIRAWDILGREFLQTVDVTV